MAGCSARLFDSVNAAFADLDAVAASATSVSVRKNVDGAAD